MVEERHNLKKQRCEPISPGILNLFVVVFGFVVSLKYCSFWMFVLLIT
jgi:hypothetical protein